MWVSTISGKIWLLFFLLFFSPPPALESVSQHSKSKSGSCWPRLILFRLKYKKSDNANNEPRRHRMWEFSLHKKKKCLACCCFFLLSVREEIFETLWRFMDVVRSVWTWDDSEIKRETMFFCFFYANHGGSILGRNRILLRTHESSTHTSPCCKGK